MYAVGVREGNEDDWEYVLQQSRATRVVSDAEVMMAALCYTRHTWLLWRCVTHLLVIAVPLVDEGLKMQLTSQILTLTMVTMVCADLRGGPWMVM